MEVSLGRFEDTPHNFSFIPLDQMDKLLAQGADGDISSLMPFYRPVPGEFSPSSLPLLPHRLYRYALPVRAKYLVQCESSP
jgi:hypothetical protein